MINKHKKDRFNLILNLILVMSFIIVGYCTLQTYAYFTDKKTQEITIQMGDMKSSIKVNSNTSETEVIEVSVVDLMYLNNEDNEGNDELKELDKYAASVVIEIENISKLNQLVEITYENQQGLYCVFTKNEEVDFTTLFPNAESIREKVETYNETFLASLATEKLEINKKIELKAYYFAVYEELTDANKAKYETLSLSSTITIKCIQYHEKVGE